MRRIFGRHCIVDERDQEYLLSTIETTRTVRKWRRGPMTDQGSIPSCVGHGWFHLLTASPVRQNPIDPDVLYYLAQKGFDEWEGEDYPGTSVRAVAKLLLYVKKIKSYKWSFGLETAVPHLLEKGPLVAGFDWHEGMSRPDRNNIIRPTGRLEGGHCILIYGANVKTGFLYIQNSWGLSWGNKGTARLSFEDAEKLIRRGGECCTPIE